VIPLLREPEVVGVDAEHAASMVNLERGLSLLAINNRFVFSHISHCFRLAPEATSP